MQIIFQLSHKEHFHIIFKYTQLMVMYMYIMFMGKILTNLFSDCYRQTYHCYKEN